MELLEPFRRVVLVVLDGLRVDAIDAFGLQTLARMRQSSAYAVTTTVEPSVTWAVMTTLMTGVTPAVHGVTSDSVHLPRPKGAIQPLPRILAAEGLPMTAVLGRIPTIFRGVASAIGRKLGVGHLRFVGDGAHDILHAASDRLTSQRRGLVFLHWPDADRAGHDHGWMSDAYAAGARALDRALGELLRLLDGDAETLIIALADHGGGGVDPKDHDSDSPHDRLVPLLFSGSGVTAGNLGPHVSLLDVPATILWALGLERPSNYVGRPITQLVRHSHRVTPATVVA